jgi:hypothetical protein
MANVKVTKMSKTENNFSKVEKDYYDTTSKKVVDFSKGFFLNIVIGVVVTVINFYTGAAIFDSSPTIITRLIGIAVPLTVIPLEIFLIRHFFKQKRFIAIGMLSSLILPLLVTGTCSFMFLTA